nr:hypothetical protein [Tanacetum cinerariifolium]
PMQSGHNLRTINNMVHKVTIYYKWQRGAQTLRARVAAKAEEKKLELLFLRWSEHHKKLGNFLRLFLFLVQKGGWSGGAFQEWKAARRAELSQYQKQIGDQIDANVDKELERWQNGRKTRIGNNDTLNLQETMDKELETHRLEHGPKTRVIPGGNNNEDEDDVEDINVGEDDMMDDVLDVDDNGRRVEETLKPEAGALSKSPSPANKE